METLFSLLREWNKSSNERAKLQHAYLAIIIVLVVLAGLITLLNPLLGNTIVSFAGFLALAFLTNAVLWALLKSFVIDRITTKRSTK